MRYHLKDVTIYKNYPANLLQRIQGIEPKFHGGYKKRVIWDGTDNVGCGIVVANLPSVTTYSVDKVRISTHAASEWRWDKEQRDADDRTPFGITAIEVYGVSDTCYSEFASETRDGSTLRKRMENGFTGCPYSSVPLFEAAERLQTGQSTPSSPHQTNAHAAQSDVANPK